MSICFEKEFEIYSKEEHQTLLKSLIFINAELIQRAKIIFSLLFNINEELELFKNLKVFNVSATEEKCFFWVKSFPKFFIFTILTIYF